MSHQNLLTKDAIARILEGEKVINPRVQVLGYKKVMGDGSDKGQVRYRFLLSDGKSSHQFCVMMGQLIERIEMGEFERFSVIQLNEYILNSLQDRKVMIILEPQLIKRGSDIGQRIGNPSAPTTPNSAGANTSFNASVPRLSAPPMASTSVPRAGRSAPVPTPSYLSDVNQVVCGIADLNPYRNRWAVKGRVSAKTPIKQWSNAKGEGKLFSFDITDDTGEIRITAFKTECEKFFDVVEVGKVFTISKAVIKPANKKFSPLNNDYELTLGNDSIVIPGDDDDSDCPKMSFNFVKIKDIAATNADSFVDVLAVCKSVGELVTFTQKNTGRELKKRDISLVDDTEMEIKLTLWGEEAERQIANEGSAVVVKKAKVSDFNGKSLTTTQNSFVQIDPTMSEAFGLRGWYERSRDTLRPKPLSVTTSSYENAQWRNLSEINLAAVRNERGALTFSTVATVIQVGKLSIYLACPTAGCKKKVTDMNNGYYKCDKCNKNFEDYEPRLILGLAISDFGGELWITLFHEDAEKILGIKAKELIQMRDANATEYEEIIGALNFRRFTFRLRSAEDRYKEEVRVRTTALAINEIPTGDYQKKLLELVNSLSL
ncbi:Replication protein A 70 kDa DNA-binding subunit-like protein [Leptotrombidium deliense]|uniref:Replication protein A subunit n=1 Tax=Leptotrombidium deliense TaxID=299467 RepID=A0A443SG97_9ACAR|nr:Replication protein A 70 kDa DNA-binding subunit-like protein [Leptotrombidium deliense]